MILEQRVRIRPLQHIPGIAGGLWVADKHFIIAGARVPQTHKGPPPPRLLFYEQSFVAEETDLSDQ